MKTIFISFLVFATQSLTAQNVGIGTTSTSLAKLTVSGGVNGTVALFQSTSGITINGGSSPSIGINYNGGNSISTGTGAKLELNSGSSGGFSLNYYSSASYASVSAGTAYSNTANIIKYTDYRALNFGHWLDILYTTEKAKINVANEMYNKSNGSLNLMPLGAITFKVTGLNNGSNANKVISNAGDGGGLYDGVYYFNVQQGSITTDGWMNLILNLDLITKEYDNIYVVGVPNHYSNGAETQAAFAEFVRVSGTTTKDRLQIWFGATELNSFTEVFGTLLIYGNRRN